MKARSVIIGLVGVAIGVLSPLEMAWARGHSHAHVGIVVGPTYYWGPYYYPRPLYYYPPYAPLVIERSPPPVYVEQPPPPVTSAPPVPATSYWYYCAASRAYYPYVGECPGGWTKVLPQAPASP